MASSRFVRLFGAPAVLDAEGAPLPKLGPGKPFALLAYILAEGPTPRQELVALLWGDVPETMARNAFRQALHRLRRVLGEEYIPQDSDLVQIADGSSLGADLLEFERALDRGDNRAALELYRGDFLSGLEVGEQGFDEWVLGKRARLSAKFADLLRASLQDDLASGDTQAALQKAIQLRSAAPLDPDAAIQYATILAGAGRRGEALHALDEFAQRYERDLGRAPQGPVRELEARLRRIAGDGPSGGSRSRAAVPLIGRDREIATLVGQWRRLEAGHGAVILLHGEAGSGKTRVIAEFLQRIKDLGGCLILSGRERAAGSGVAYASIAEALRGALDAPGLAGTSQHLLAEASRLIPQLRDMFPLPELGDIRDDAGRLRFYEGVAALLDSVAYEQPVCVSLDDFHNSSSTTFELACYLAERLTAAPILFLFSGRPTAEFSRLSNRFGNGADAAQEGKHHTMMLDLKPLDAASAATLAREVAHGSLSGDKVEAIVNLSGGMPFRLIEFARRALAGEPLAAMPQLLRDVLWGRLQTCTQSQQRVFVALALLDRPASVRLLAGAAHLSESSALDAVLALESQGLVVQRDAGVMPAHDCAPQLALDGTGPAGRALLAGWAAEALLADGSGSDAELATLFAAAGRRPEAFQRSRAAGYKAAAVGALDEAAHHFQVAMTTASGDDDREDILRAISALGWGPARLAGEVQAESAQAAAEALEAKPDLPEDAAPQSAPPDEARAPSPQPVPRPRPFSRFTVRWTPWLAIAASLLLLVGLARGIRRTRDAAAPGTSLSDTLFVTEETATGGSAIAFSTGPIGLPATSTSSPRKFRTAPAWTDSLRLPWINPRPSPDGRTIAVERVSAHGTDLFAISSDRRDTIPLANNPGDNISAGWSPDGHWLLATRGHIAANGAYDSDLLAYSIPERGRRIALDTSGSRAVVDAQWSPDGSRIAWTARVGPEHQQEIFVSDADGENLRDVSNDSSEDYDIAWAPDGGRIAFTSERTGHAELYSTDLISGNLRRLTWDSAHSDRAAYSPDGRWIAYESTRGGRPHVYVMPSWGGTGRDVDPGDTRTSILGWRGRPLSYIDRISVAVDNPDSPEADQRISAREYDQFGQTLAITNLRVRVLDSSVARIQAGTQPGEDRPLVEHESLLARSSGLARVEASAGSWRADTAFVRVGSGPLRLLREDFEKGLNPAAWTSLGRPKPLVEPARGEARSRGLVARSDRQWESGILSTRIFPVRTGLAVDAWVAAQFDDRAAFGGSFVVALVAADPAGVPDSVAPEFFRLAEVSLLGQAGRIRYAVDRESFTEPLRLLPPAGAHRIGMRVESDATIGFYVDGLRRWKSTLKARMEGENSRAQLWLGSRASASGVVFDNVNVELQRSSTAR